MTWRMSWFRFGASSPMVMTMTKHPIDERGKVTGRVFGPAGKEKVQTAAFCPAESVPDWAARPERMET